MCQTGSLWVNLFFIEKNNDNQTPASFSYPVVADSRGAFLPAFFTKKTG
jgi:hypothetical protein